MDFLKNQNVEEFKDAGATINFIRIFDSLFDVMNTQRIVSTHPNQLKSALNSHNKEEVFAFLLKAKQYILGLKIEDAKGDIIPIVESKVKTGFRGYVINIESLLAIYQEYVQKDNLMGMIATYRFSQDHLERFFGKIRYAQGCNDNPTIQQFTSCYRKLQLMSDFEISRYSNVTNISSTDILMISSRPRINEMIQQPNEKNNSRDEEILELETIERASYLMDKCNNSAISFVAYKIEKRLLCCEQVYCSYCERVLNENEKIDRRDCVGNNIPCKSTQEICKATDRAMKMFMNGNVKEDFTAKVIGSVMSTIDFNKIYPLYYEPEHDVDHKHFLVRFIINEYKHIKNIFSSKQKTLDLHKEFFRQKNIKSIHFAGL